MKGAGAARRRSRDLKTEEILGERRKGGTGVNRLLKSALRRGAIGFALGMLVDAGILCAVCPGVFAGEAGPGTLIAYFISSGLYGAVVMGATVAYDIERWSITRATLTHLFVALGGLYAMGLVQGWLTFSVFGFLVPTLGFIAAYFLIWLVQCLSYRRKVSQMNRTMKAWKSLQRAQSPSDGA